MEHVPPEGRGEGEADRVPRAQRNAQQATDKVEHLETFVAQCRRVGLPAIEYTLAREKKKKEEEDREEFF